MNRSSRAREALRWPLAALFAALACNACSAPAPSPQEQEQESVAPPVAAENSPAPTGTSAPAATRNLPSSANAPSPAAPQTQTPAREAAASTRESESESVASVPAITAPRKSPKPAVPVTTAPIEQRPIPAPQPPSPAQQIGDDAQPSTIAIYSLSRGKGVPSQTREALKQIRALLERQQAAKTVSALQSNRIGIEGETRLCAEFRNPQDAQTALAEIRKIAAGVELLNVVEEPCPSRKEVSP